MTAPLILLVEDNSTVRCALCAILERDGYTVLSANNGQEALKLLARSEVKLILSDLEMPRMDGRELLQTLRADPQYAHLPFVVMILYPWDVLTLRADAFLVKPLLQAADLLLTLQNLIGPH